MQRVELLERLERVLRGVKGVSHAAYFGSLAKGTADAWSDIDLIVCCDSDAAWATAARLAEELSVVLYRPFTSARAPSGRYWFESAHPFHRLDVSFHDAPAYHTVVSEGGEFARAPFRHLDLALGPRSVSEARSPRPEWSLRAQDFADALRNFQEAAKAVARGKEPKRPLPEERARVEAFGAEGLPAAAWVLYEHSAALVDALRWD